jgi:hypothetical protein
MKKVTHHKRFISILVVLACCFSVKAQEVKLDVELRFGLNFNLNVSSASSFPGASVFGSFLLSSRFKNLKGSLGNDRNLLQSDFQFDFNNALTLGYGFNEIGYQKYAMTMQNCPAYNLKHNFKYAFFVSTNFLLNHHGRNQAVGSITATVDNFSVNYYNDGALPLGIADNFDRWWTGGLAAIIHSKKGFNTVEATFDQFTGYSPLLYEISTILGINVSEYYHNKNGDADPIYKTITPSSYNCSAYNVRVYLAENFAVQAGVIGSLKYRDKLYGLQDIIHARGRFSLHPNKDLNRFSMGLTYNKGGYYDHN